MVALEEAVAANKALVQQRPLIAVFVGGTAGIGAYTIRSLAATHGTTGVGLRLYIVGRNAKAASELVEECHSTCPAGDFRFIQVEDLSLITNVDECCKRIVESENKQAGDARVDLLMMTQGVLDFGGRRETSEGLDFSMSLLYYSRIRFIQQLSSLYKQSSRPTHVISVYSGGLEKKGTLFPSDLGLHEPGHYSFSSARTNITYMKTMMFEHFASTYEGKITLAHVFPGIVVTEAMNAQSNPWWFKIGWKLSAPFVKRFFSVPQEEIGPRLLYLMSSRFPPRGSKDESGNAKPQRIAVATDGAVGGGAYSVTHYGETCDINQLYSGLRKNGFGEKVLQHTMKAFEDIENDKSTA